MNLVLLLICLLLTGCGRYGDFHLPALSGAPPQPPVWNPYPDPVMERGQWRDLLNPSVAKSGSTYHNYYSVWDGKAWRTGHATSEDGRSWTDLGVFLSPPAGGYIAANGHVLLHNGKFLHWYHAGSKELPHIAFEGKPVLEPGPRGSWDERGVADPYVIEAGGAFYMYYLGQDRARRQRLGLARSRDGVAWEKLRSNPILELGGLNAFDEIGLGEPAVFVWQNVYWMMYTGRDRAEHRRLGLAWSRDGVQWTRLPWVAEGRQPWNQAVLCDPTALVEADTVHVWFGGGSKPSPDENLDGQIGFATLLK